MVAASSEPLPPPPANPLLGTGDPSREPAAAPASPAFVRRLGWAWLPGNAAFPLMWSAVTGVLVALQVARIDPAGKVQNLGLITGAAAFMTLLVQPIAGRLSDNTRTRWGRRSPWVLTGSLLAAVAIAMMGYVHSIGLLLVVYLCVVVTVNSAQLPMSALLPDRVPAPRRGLFASLAAVGQGLGGLVGQLLASATHTHLAESYWSLAGIVAVVMLGFVVLVREPADAEVPKEALNWRALLDSYWVDPRRNPDFGWVFVSRFLLLTGYFLTNSYQLYILQDYIGLGDRAVSYVPLTSTVTFASVLLFGAIGGPLSDRLGRRRIFVQLSSYVFALALLTPMLLPTLGGILLSNVIGGIGYGIFGSVDTALMSQVLPTETGHGKDLGVINLSWTLPQSVSPFLASGLITATGGYTALFPIGAALAVAGGVAVMFVRKVR
ncbi:MFS transporter [Streptantibioticus parmotrematis]|uniref:MFS transporter n=1 Tax=Streptantibioticus parmotrematis TaxID=2873249 RepID=UPI0033DD1A7E